MNNPTVSRKAYSGKTSSLHKLCLSITDCHHSTPVWTDAGKIVVRNFNIKDGKLDLSNPSYTDENTFNERTARSRPEAGDLIITREAPMGEVCIIPEGIECCLGQRMVLIKPDKKKVDGKYLLYAMLSDFVQSQINQSDKTGSIVSNLRIPLLKALEIPLVEDAEEVAAVLAAIDAKIDCNNRINAELEAMAKTLYDYWFVQFDFPDANGNPYKSAGGKMVYNADLKQTIPEQWEVVSLSDWIASDKTGDWGKEKAEGNYTLCVDCIRGADINGLNGFGTTSPPMRFILEKNKSKVLAPFNFVIEISGGSPTQSTGRIAPITINTIKRFSRPLICSNFCKAISLKDNAYFFNFAHLWQSAYDNKVLFGWEGKTSGIKNLLFDAFTSKYLVSKPPKELAQSYFEFVAAMEAKKQKLLQETEGLQALRDWLLPMLMNGQVKVTTTP